MSAWSRFALAAACLGLALSSSGEQPAYRLDLKPAKGLPNGKVATLKGIASAKPDQFFIENVFVLQPVVVTLVAKNAGDAIKVRLGKHRWDETLMEGVTGPGGKAILKLRTQGELRISVSAEGERKPYGLVVWVGDEVKAEPESAIMTMSDFRKANPSSIFDNLGSALLWGLGAALVAALVTGAFLLGRKRGAK